MYEFKGKVAIVTGAARGIGKEIAIRLAQEGASLVLMDLLSGDLADALTNSSRGKIETMSIVLDVRERSALMQAAEEVIGRFGRIHFLVNVAGVGECNHFFDVSEEEWKRTIDINLKGTFLTCQVIGKYMAEKKQGRIVNISSISGKTGDEILVPYSASKAGVIVLTQSLAKALSPFGITVNAVCPGLVWTPMWSNTAIWLSKNSPRFANKNISPKQIFESVVKALTPLKQPTTTKDVAATVAFLLSDEARMITGQAINVDGGIELH